METVSSLTLRPGLYDSFGPDQEPGFFTKEPEPTGCVCATFTLINHK